jgi:transcriptional regulator GlxA family with amidase domain
MLPNALLLGHRSMIGLLLAITTARLLSFPANRDGQPPTARAGDPAQRPNDRRLVIAVVGSNDGTELTDFLIPRAILAEAAVAEVVTVAPSAGKIRMLAGTSLTVDPDLTIAAFDAAHPRGAGYVIVPAIEPSAAIVNWLRRQAALGATIVGICDGVLTVASTGLLDQHRATGHWASLPGLRKKYPGTTWVPDRRYVIDGRLVTTTGVSAAIPTSLMLIERIAGRAAAERIARRIAVADWNSAHDSHAFSLSRMPYPMPAFMDSLARWRRDTVAVRLDDGVDEVALGLTLDALSRRATVLTVSDGALLVTGRQGLRFSADRRRSDRIPLVRELQLPDASSPPANALDAALTKLASWYGAPVADFVALQMEYPWQPPR